MKPNFENLIPIFLVDGDPVLVKDATTGEYSLLCFECGQALPLTKPVMLSLSITLREEAEGA